MSEATPDLAVFEEAASAGRGDPYKSSAVTDVTMLLAIGEASMLATFS